MRFLVSTENIENEILLFSVYGSFEKIFSLKMSSKIQPNAFSSPFSISSKNENRKQSNQTPPRILLLCKVTRKCVNDNIWSKILYFSLEL